MAKSSEALQHSEINREPCIICQTKTHEKIQCLADSKRSDIRAGYKSFIEILPQFVEIGMLPVALK